MKKLLLIAAIIFAGTSLYAITDEQAQEWKTAYDETGKLTPEQADSLIAYYARKEAKMKDEIAKLEPEVNNLREEVNKLRAKRDSLQKVLAELKGEITPEEKAEEAEAAPVEGPAVIRVPDWFKAEVPKTKKVVKYDYYTVKEGDWLAKLAEYPEVYGHGNYAWWIYIYEANKDLIKDPNIIYPGWKLRIPRFEK